MAVDPKNLTVDFRQLMRMTVRDRVAFARSAEGPSFLESLSPVQYALLFPGYWKKIISIPGAEAGLAGIPSASFTSGGISSGLPAGGGVPEMPAGGTASPELKPSWFNRYMSGKSTSTQADLPSAPSVPGTGNPLSSQRQIASSQLSQEMKIHMYALTMAEVGRTNPAAQRALMETIYNRYSAQKKSSLGVTMGADYYEPLRKSTRGYQNYLRARADLQNNPDLYREMDRRHNEVLAGSNDSNYATHNGSAGIAAGARRTQTIGAVLGGETFSRKDNPAFAKLHGAGTVRNESEWYRKVQAQMKAFQSGQSLENATKTIEQDSSKTGQVMPEPGLRPGGSPFDVIDKNQIDKINASRPDYIRGKIFFDDGSDPFDYGSGGRKRGSIPYGTHELRPGLWEHSNIRSFRNNSFYVKDMFDPKVGDMRRGILIHSASDMDKLYSAGCIAVNRSQWRDFKAKMLQYQRINDGKPIYISVDPTTNNVNITTNMPAGGGVNVNRVIKDVGSDTGQKQPTNIQPPPGYDALPEELRKQIDSLSSNDRSSLFEKMRKEAEQGINPVQELTKAFQVSPEVAIAEAKALVEPTAENISGIEQRVIERQSEIAGTRKGALSERLKRQINYASNQAGVYTEVFSGGQRMEGAPGAVGSTRHDKGNAADVYLYRIQNGKKVYLNQNNPEDREVMKKFMMETVRAGATGVGSGPGYMEDVKNQKSGIHIGGGSDAYWGAAGLASNAPSWVAEAWTEGRKGRKSFSLDEWERQKAQGNVRATVEGAVAPDVSGSSSQTGSVEQTPLRPTQTAPTAPTASPVADQFPSENDPFKGIEFPKGMPKPDLDALSPEYKRWAALQDRTELQNRISKGWQESTSGILGSVAAAAATPGMVSSSMQEKFNAARANIKPEDRDKMMAELQAKRDAEIKAATDAAEAAKTAPEAPKAEAPAEAPKAQTEEPPKMYTGGQGMLTNPDTHSLGTVGPDGKFKPLASVTPGERIDLQGNRFTATPERRTAASDIKAETDSRLDQGYAQAEATSKASTVQENTVKMVNTSRPNERFAGNMGVGDPMTSGSFARFLKENQRVRDTSRIAVRPGQNFSRLT